VGRAGIRFGWSRHAVAFGCAAALVLASGVSSAAAHPPFAPLDHRGPPVSVPKPALHAALECTPRVRDAKVEPVLLNPATGVTADQNYSWNWEPALDRLGIPWCAYTPPAHTLGDIQLSGEYLAWSIRHTYRLAGRRIAVVGHSQGGMSMRWALRFWPNTRKMVADVVGFAGTNHGTTVRPPLACSAEAKCPAAEWQQFDGSNFIQALNSRAETFKGVSYTEVYSHTDEVVRPNSNDQGTSSLHTGQGRIRNVATQDVCPADIREHLMIGTIDPVAYALGIDAITHRGPAKEPRIPRSVCNELYMPGVNPLNVEMYLQILGAQPGLLAVDIPGINLAGVEELPAEPPLACYVYARCRGRG
jgi:hypothetical protein